MDDTFLPPTESRIESSRSPLEYAMVKWLFRDGLKETINIHSKKPSKEPLFVGTLVHPNGNISELLLKEGFAKCVDWSLGMMTG